MPAKKTRSRKSSKPSAEHGDSVLLRLAVGAVLLGMVWAAVPLAKALTTTITSVVDQAFSAAVTAPSSGSTISGTVPLEARVAAAASSGIFTLSGGPNGLQQPIQGTQDASDALKWTAKLDASVLVAGTYALGFSAVRAVDGLTASSPQISLIVADQAPAKYVITFVSPRSGSTVSGTVALTAGVNLAADSLTYVVTPVAGGGLVELKSSFDGTNGTWVGSWNTAEFPNGTYTVVPHAFHAAVMEVGDPVTLTVSNAAPPPTFTATVRTPASGSALKGIVTFSSVTNLAATGLAYVVTDAGGAPVASLNAAPSNGSLQWDATWDTTAVSNGTYSLKATSIRTGAQAEAGPVSFTIANQAASTLLTVLMAAPAKGAVVSGSVQVYAQTSLAADSLSFTITQTFGSKHVTQLAAAGGPTSWYAAWDSSALEPGAYLIHATALKGTGTNVSDDVAFSVTAPSAGSPTPVSAAVNVTVPVSGATVAGQMSLAARTDSAVDLAGFELRNAVAPDAAPVATVAASGADGGTSWTATMNTTAIPDGEYVVVAVVTRNGVKASSAAVPVHLKNLTSGQAAVPSFEIRSPAPGASVSGIVPFYASSSAAIDGLAFILQGPTVPGSRMALPATGNAEKTAWTVNWNSGTVPDGSVSLSAVASKSGHESEGAPRAFTVANGASAPVQPPPTATAPPAAATTFKVTVVNPVTGQIYAGQVPLAAAVDGGTALNVRFTVGAASGGAVADIDAHFDSKTKRWVALWKPDAAATGTYVVTATAQNTRGQTAQSERVKVLFGASRPGEPAAPGSPPSPPEVPKPVVSGEKAALIVKISSPVASSVLRGPAVLAADAEGAAEVGFAIRPIKEGEATTRRAASDGTRWVAYLDTTAIPDGDYEIEASAVDAAGNRAVSQRLPFGVRNAGGGAPVSRVDVVPPAAVVASVLERPQGSVSLSADPLPQSVSDATDQLNADCIARKVPAERCSEWLARQSERQECAAAGIVTKEECLAYLKSKRGGQVAACEGRTDEDCAKVVAIATADLIFDADLRALRDAALQNVGRVLQMPPRGKQAAGGGDIPPAPPGLADLSPFAGEAPVNVGLHASPGFGTTDGNVAHQNLPAFVMVDTDGDNLPDDIELRLGTDPRNPDSDGDGYNDGLEVERGYNPLGPGALLGNVTLAPVDQAVISGIAIEQPTDAGTVAPDLKVETAVAQKEKEGTFTIGGRAKPHDVVTVFVYSYLPVVFTTAAKDDGTWTYDLGTGLADGQHEAYATVTDDTGKISAKSEPLSFFVSGAKAVTQDEFFNPSSSPLSAAAVAAPSQALLGWYIGAVAMLMGIALVVSFLLFMRPKKNQPPPPSQ